MSESPSDQTPVTLADWRDAYEGAGDPGNLLTALLHRMGWIDAPVYLNLIAPKALDCEIERLRELRRAAPDWQGLWRNLPLWGIPFVAKDNIDVAGLPTTAACPAYEYAPSCDAECVASLRAAGAVCLGKTNMDQFATGLVGARSPYGALCSVWSSEHVSGGSSSGSAVAVASGHVPLALGTDTAGSGRIPAAFNGIVGVKPTPGVVSNHGVVPACASLDCVSVFAQNLPDAGAALRVLTRRNQPANALHRTGATNIRIGFPEVFDERVDTEVAQAFAVLLEALHGSGLQALPRDFADLAEVAAQLYEGPWVAERLEATSVLLDRDPGALDPTVRQILTGAQDYSVAELLDARSKLAKTRRAIDAIWSEFDALIVPSAPYQPTLAEVDQDPIGANAGLGAYCNFVNLLGWCALTIPTGETDAGRPMSATLIGPAGADWSLLNLARLVRPELGAVSAPPDALMRLPVVAVGAHLSGLPLNYQLTELGGVFERAARTVPEYRLYALPGTTPSKPALVRTAPSEGAPIDCEVWSLPASKVGAFLAQIPAPLGLGTIELEDGSAVKGFLGEGYAVLDAEDISSHGGWRAYLASRSA